MPDYSTPAIRVYNILEKFESARVDKAKLAWQKAFGLGGEFTLAQMCLQVNLLLNQLDETRRVVHSLPKFDHQLYDEDLDSLRTFLVMHAFAEPAERKTEFPLGPWRSLRYMHEAISGEFPENPIDSETILELLGEAKALYESVSESDMPRELKITLHSSLHGIISSLETYAISGNEAINTALNETLGKIMRTPRTEAEPQPDSDGSDLKTKFAIFLHKVNNTVTTAASWLKLTEEAQNILEKLDF